MSPLRRTTVASTLILATSTIWLELLPQRPDTALAPTLALLASLIFVCVPLAQLPGLAIVAAGCGAAGLSTFALAQTPAHSLAIAASIPLVVALSRAKALGILAAGLSAVAVAAAFEVLGPANSGHADAEHLRSWQTWSSSSYTDLVGAAMLLAWSGYAMWGGVDVFTCGWRLQRVRAAIRSFDAGIEHDRRELTAITEILADAELTPVFSGHGIDHDHLNMATRLGRDRVLLGCITGDPLATMSAAWALRACAMAGTRNPETLMNLADRELWRLSPTLEFGVEHGHAFAPHPHALCSQLSAVLLGVRLDARLERERVAEQHENAQRPAPQESAPDSIAGRPQLIELFAFDSGHIHAGNFRQQALGDRRIVATNHSASSLGLDPTLGTRGREDPCEALGFELVLAGMAP